MIAAVAFQACSGLFANDDILLEGPYASMVGKEASDLLTRLHKINSKIILALIALHLSAIAYHFLRLKTNLVVPMITGRKDAIESVADASRPGGVALLVAILAAAAVYLLVTR